MKIEPATRDRVLRALKAYELDWTKIEYIGKSDSVTFKLETETAGKLLLRIHGERCSREEILSELEWLSHLSQTAELVVPVGLPNSSGRYILEAGNEAGNEPYGGAQQLNYVTLMRWVEGEHSAGNLTDEQLHAVGVMLARMHEAGEQFVPSAEFIRPAWERTASARDGISWRSIMRLWCRNRGGSSIRLPPPESRVNSRP